MATNKDKAQDRIISIIAMIAFLGSNIPAGFASESGFLMIQEDNQDVPTKPVDDSTVSSEPSTVQSSTQSLGDEDSTPLSAPSADTTNGDAQVIAESNVSEIPPEEPKVAEMPSEGIEMPSGTYKLESGHEFVYNAERNLGVDIAPDGTQVSFEDILFIPGGTITCVADGPCAMSEPIIALEDGQEIIGVYVKTQTVGCNVQMISRTYIVGMRTVVKAIRAQVVNDLVVHYGFTRDSLKELIKKGQIKIDVNWKDLTTVVKIGEDVALAPDAVFYIDPLGERKLPSTITYQLREGLQMGAPCVLDTQGAAWCPPPSFVIESAQAIVDSSAGKYLYQISYGRSGSYFYGDGRIMTVKVYHRDPLKMYPMVCTEAGCLLGDLVKDIRYIYSLPARLLLSGDPDANITGPAPIFAIIRYANPEEDGVKIRVVKFDIRDEYGVNFKDKKYHMVRVLEVDSAGKRVVSKFKYWEIISRTLEDVVCIQIVGAECGPVPIYHYALAVIDRFDAYGKALSHIYLQGPGNAVVAVEGAEEKVEVQFTDLEDLLDQVRKLELMQRIAVPVTFLGTETYYPHDSNLVDAAHVRRFILAANGTWGQKGVLKISRDLRDDDKIEGVEILSWDTQIPEQFDGLNYYIRFQLGVELEDGTAYRPAPPAVHRLFDDQYNQTVYLNLGDLILIDLYEGGYTPEQYSGQWQIKSPIAKEYMTAEQEEMLENFFKTEEAVEAAKRALAEALDVSLDNIERLFRMYPTYYPTLVHQSEKSELIAEIWHVGMDLNLWEELHEDIVLSPSGAFTADVTVFRSGEIKVEFSEHTLKLIEEIKGKLKVVQAAKENLAKQLQVSVDQISLVGIEKVELTFDGCLNLPNPDEACTRILQDGYKIVLAWKEPVDSVNDEDMIEREPVTFIYHANLSGTEVRFNAEESAKHQIELAIADLKSKMPEAGDVSLWHAEAELHVWGNSCERDGGEICAMVYMPVRGYIIKLHVGEKEFVYHTDLYDYVKLITTITPKEFPLPVPARTITLNDGHQFVYDTDTTGRHIDEAGNETAYVDVHEATAFGTICPPGDSMQPCIGFEGIIGMEEGEVLIGEYTTKEVLEDGSTRTSRISLIGKPVGTPEFSPQFVYDENGTAWLLAPPVGETDGKGQENGIRAALAYLHGVDSEAIRSIGDYLLHEMVENGILNYTVNGVAFSRKVRSFEEELALAMEPEPLPKSITLNDGHTFKYDPETNSGVHIDQEGNERSFVDVAFSTTSESTCQPNSDVCQVWKATIGLPEGHVEIGSYTEEEVAADGTKIIRTILITGQEIATAVSLEAPVPPETIDPYDIIANLETHIWNHLGWKGSPNFNPNLDLNDDGIINSSDVIRMRIIARATPEMFERIYAKIMTEVKGHVGASSGEPWADDAPDYVAELDMNRDGRIDVKDVELTDELFSVIREIVQSIAYLNEVAQAQEDALQQAMDAYRTILGVEIALSAEELEALIQKLVLPDEEADRLRKLHFVFTFTQQTIRASVIDDVDYPEKPDWFEEFIESEGLHLKLTNMLLVVSNGRFEIPDVITPEWLDKLRAEVERVRETVGDDPHAYFEGQLKEVQQSVQEVIASLEKINEIFKMHLEAHRQTILKRIDGDISMLQSQIEDLRAFIAQAIADYRAKIQEIFSWYAPDRRALLTLLTDLRGLLEEGGFSEETKVAIEGFLGEMSAFVTEARSIVSQYIWSLRWTLQNTLSALNGTIKYFEEAIATFRAYREKVLNAQTEEELKAIEAEYPVFEAPPLPVMPAFQEFVDWPVLHERFQEAIARAQALIEHVRAEQKIRSLVLMDLVNAFSFTEEEIEEIQHLITIEVDLAKHTAEVKFDERLGLMADFGTILFDPLGSGRRPHAIHYQLGSKFEIDFYELRSASFTLDGLYYDLYYWNNRLLEVRVSKEWVLVKSLKVEDITADEKTGEGIFEVHIYYHDSPEVSNGVAARSVTLRTMDDGLLHVQGVADFTPDGSVIAQNRFEYDVRLEYPACGAENNNPECLSLTPGVSVRLNGITRTDAEGHLLSTITQIHQVIPAVITLPTGEVTKVEFETIEELLALALEFEAATSNFIPRDQMDPDLVAKIEAMLGKVFELVGMEIMEGEKSSKYRIHLRAVHAGEAYLHLTAPTNGLLDVTQEYGVTLNVDPSLQFISEPVPIEITAHDGVENIGPIAVGQEVILTVDDTGRCQDLNDCLYMPTPALAWQFVPFQDEAGRFSLELALAHQVRLQDIQVESVRQTVATADACFADGFCPSIVQFEIYYFVSGHRYRADGVIKSGGMEGLRYEVTNIEELTPEYGLPPPEEVEEPENPEKAIETTDPAPLIQSVFN